MKKDSKIFVAGHNGLVGSSIIRLLHRKGFSNIFTRSRLELDLRQQEAVASFFAKEKPEYVFLAAAQVGGIMANNNYPAEFIYNNLMIECNVIHQSYLNGVKKLLFLGSSCIYPKFSSQPMTEEFLMTGELEPTNAPYAIAKIAGIQTCQSYNRQYGTNFIAAMPTNLYGPNDNYDLDKSHVLPALLRKFHEAKLKGDPAVVIWGSGRPMREFLHVDDCASACLFLMQEYNKSAIVNVGTGQDCTIRHLAEIIRKITGFKGELIFDENKPDGTPRKLLDVQRLHALGWHHQISLEAGIAATYEDFVSNYNRYTQPYRLVPCAG